MSRPPRIDIAGRTPRRRRGSSAPAVRSQKWPRAGARALIRPPAIAARVPYHEAEAAAHALHQHIEAGMVLRAVPITDIVDGRGGQRLVAGERVATARLPTTETSVTESR